jgi:hypothetical protein
MQEREFCSNLVTKSLPWLLDATSFVPNRTKSVLEQRNGSPLKNSNIREGCSFKNNNVAPAGAGEF